MQSIVSWTVGDQRTSKVALRVAVEEREPALSRLRKSMDHACVIDVAQALGRPVLALELPHSSLLPMARLPVRHVFNLHVRKKAIAKGDGAFFNDHSYS